MAGKARRTGATLLVESLEKAGAEIVFGYPGANITSVFERFATADFDVVVARHEQGAVHMADGYARATGRPGVVIVTSGPGATNAITGLATANVDGVPLVLISGQVSLGEIGTDAFQEADMTGICRAATKHSFLVQSAAEIPETVAEAFYIATHGKPGTVVIDLPRNVQDELAEARYPERISLRAYHPEHAASVKEIAILAKYINAAKRPMIYAGGGVIASGSAENVVALAKKAGMPVVTTLMGIGAIDGRDEYSLGMSGMYGTKAANKAIEQADLILALGVRFNDRATSTMPKNVGKKIVHVDCDPSSIDKNISVRMGIVADIKDLLTTVDSRVRSVERQRWWHKEYDCDVGKKPTVRQVVEELETATKGEARLVTDVGEHQMMAARHYRSTQPRQFLTSGGMGTMGFGIPAAIGAALADRDRKVIAIVGDGGAQMTFEELIVAVEKRLAITVVIVNNQALGMVKMAISSPDFVKLASAYGIKGVRVKSRQELKKALQQAMKAKSPRLVEVMA